VALAAGCLVLSACADFHLPGMAEASPEAEEAPAGTVASPPSPAVPAPAEPAEGPITVPVPSPEAAAPGVQDPVEEARALVARDQVDAAMALLKRTLADGTASAEDALYWIAVLSFGPPISDPEQGSAALSRLLDEYPDGAHRHEAKALKVLLDRVDQLQADNASLKGDLQKLLNIDVEAQRQRRGTSTAAPSAPAPAPGGTAPAAP